MGSLLKKKMTKLISRVIITIWTKFEKFFWLDFANFRDFRKKSNGKFSKIGISGYPQN